jgi:hypothetical protein
MFRTSSAIECGQVARINSNIWNFDKSARLSYPPVRQASVIARLDSRHHIGRAGDALKSLRSTGVGASFISSGDNMRVPIPKELAAEVWVKHDGTCCVCQQRGKAVQIHHVDEDPSNNGEENLAVLCLECHDDTQVRGGFGRKLGAAQVIKYRDDWVARVTEVRRQADALMVQKQIGLIEAASNRPIDWRPPSALELTIYLDSIPSTMEKAYAFARQEWDKGATGVVTQATYQLVRVAERLWVGLSAWYPPNYFGNVPAAEYVSKYISARYELRNALIEPEGPRTAGTMIRPMVAYGVLLDMQELIKLTAQLMILFRNDIRIDIDNWVKQFDRATSSYPC